MKLKICPIDKQIIVNSLGYLSCTDYVAWLVTRPLLKKRMKFKLGPIRLSREISSWFLLETDFRFEFLVQVHTAKRKATRIVSRQETIPLISSPNSGPATPGGPGGPWPPHFLQGKTFENKLLQTKHLIVNCTMGTYWHIYKTFDSRLNCAHDHQYRFFMRFMFYIACKKSWLTVFLFYESEKRNIPCIVYYYLSLLFHTKQFIIRLSRAK